MEGQSKPHFYRLQVPKYRIAVYSTMWRPGMLVKNTNKGETKAKQIKQSAHLDINR